MCVRVDEDRLSLSSGLLQGRFRFLVSARDRAGMQGRACVIIDEAVPRDVEDACADIDGVRLYNLEALASIVDEGMAERVASVGDVERLIAEAEESFFAAVMCGAANMQPRSFAVKIGQTLDQLSIYVARKLKTSSCRS